jgi:hypothetical protein
LYTYTYREVFENINQKLPKRVVVNGWVSSPDPSKELGLIMDISENNQLKIWRSYSLANVPETPTGWYEFTAYFPLTNQSSPLFHQDLWLQRQESCLLRRFQDHLRILIV